MILIRKSISSMKRHLEKMTDRLPYHFDDDMISNHSATSPQINAKDTTMDTMVGHQSPDPEVAICDSFLAFFLPFTLIDSFEIFLEIFEPADAGHWIRICMNTFQLILIIIFASSL